MSYTRFFNDTSLVGNLQRERILDIENILEDFDHKRKELLEDVVTKIIAPYAKHDGLEVKFVYRFRPIVEISVKDPNDDQFYSFADIRLFAERTWHDDVDENEIRVILQSRSFLKPLDNKAVIDVVYDIYADIAEAYEEMLEAKLYKEERIKHLQAEKSALADELRAIISAIQAQNREKLQRKLLKGFDLRDLSPYRKYLSLDRTSRDWFSASWVRVIRETAKQFVVEYKYDDDLTMEPKAVKVNKDYFLTSLRSHIKSADERFDNAKTESANA